jgi:sugar phosphate isomerase/epimerase
VNQGVEATLAPLRERGLEVCQIGAFGFNALSTDHAARAAQRALLEAAIPCAPSTGCSYIVINGGNYHPSGFGAADSRNFCDAALDELARELEPLVRLAERHGVRLSIEPYLKTAICCPERFIALQSRIGSGALRSNIDVTSLYDFWDVYDSRATVEHVCSSLAGHYGLVHVKDVGLAEGFHIHISLAPLGSSATDWAQVLQLVSPHLPADSWVILEHILSPDEGRRSLQLLKKAAESAGVLLD